MDMIKKVVHLIPNAHLDPVFLWAWEEGFNESLVTFRSMTELMARYPELTFVHGEAQSYEPVEQYDPELFEQIRELIRAGRWDVVGGAYVQTDNNFPETGTFVHQFRRGQRYFQEKFGIESTVAWSPDPAGHAAGMPEIFAAAGLRYFSFNRPPEGTLPLPNPAFVWSGRSGVEILCCRTVPSYVSEKATTGQSLEESMVKFAALPQRNFMFCIGMGDHGGGTTARQIEDLLEVRRKHPEWEIVFSTLTRFFTALEADRSLLPVRREEVNFTLHGVYTANAKIKHKFRDLETAVNRSARSCAVIARALQLPTPDFSAEWDTVLFNTFHDIIPGDGIDRSNREQIIHMDSAIRTAKIKEFTAVNTLIKALDVPLPPPYAADAPTQVPYVFFNPRPVPFDGFVELEGTLDYRPLFEYFNRMNEVPFDIRDEHQHSLPFQPIDTEFGPEGNPIPWRKRGLLHLDIPAFGYRLLYFGMCEKMPPPPAPSAVAAPAPDRITNGIYTVAVTGDRLTITRNGRPVFNRDGIEFASFRDRYGCWGAMDDAEEAWTCREKLFSWKVTGCKILESGPERAKMFVMLEGGKSLMYLQIAVSRDVDAVDFSAVLNWADRGLRLRMMFDQAETVTYQVPGGETTRTGKLGDVPGGRWLEAQLTTGPMGLASDHFSGFSAMEDYFSVIMMRGTFAATGHLDVADEAPERIPCDLGEHRFQWSLTATPGMVRERAEQIQYPPTFVEAWKHRGQTVPCSFSITPDCVRLLDLERVGDHFRLTVQNESDTPVTAQIDGAEIALPPWQIVNVQA